MEGTILVVDDEPSIRLTTKSRLEAKGFAVGVAEDGEDALEKLKERSYDIVLLDINMPKLNGIQALEVIVKEYPLTDVVMLTSFADFSVAVDCLKKGAKDYLVKPIDSSELVTRLKSLLRAQVSERALMDCRQFWRSTILFDVFSHLNSINAILEHTTSTFVDLGQAKEVELSNYARGLNEKIIATLKSTVQIDELAEGTLLTQQNKTKFDDLLKSITERYEVMAAKQNVTLTLSLDTGLPLVSCDTERMEQVLNSIFEIMIWHDWNGKEISVSLRKSSQGLHGQDAKYLLCSFGFPEKEVLPAKTTQILNAPDTEWKNMRDVVSIGAFNLAISKRILEAHGGEFKITSENGSTSIQFTLPVI